MLLLDVTEVRGYRLLTEGRNAEVVYRVNRQIVDMLHHHNAQAAVQAAAAAIAGMGAEVVAAAAEGVLASGGAVLTGTRKRSQWVHGSPMKIVARTWAHASDRVHNKEGGREIYGMGK